MSAVGGYHSDAHASADAANVAEAAARRLSVDNGSNKNFVKLMPEQIRHTSAPILLKPWLVIAAASAYGVLSLVLQWRIGASFWPRSSPIEVLTDLLAIGATVFALMQVWRHWSQRALRSGWIYGAVGMAILVIGETSDWFHDDIEDWYDPLPYEIGLWLLAAFLIWRCTRNYAAQKHVRYWLLAGFVVQVLSNLLAIAEDDAAVIELGRLGSIHLTIEYTELLGLLCYASALVFTQVGPRLATAVAKYLISPVEATLPIVASAELTAAPVRIGAQARQAFYHFHLFRKPRYPTSTASLHRRGLREAVWFGMIALFAGATAMRAWAAGGASPLGQLRDLWRLSFRSRVDAFTYYLLELYRPERRVEADYCLTRYETKNGLLSRLNSMRDRDAGAPRNMTDKLAFAESCASLQVATPPVLIAAKAGMLDIRQPEDLDGDLFVKLRHGRGTKLTQRFHRIAPYRYVDRAGTKFDLDGVLEWLRQRSSHRASAKHSALIVQPHLRNHASLADLADQSLLAIRVVTCLNESGVPEVTHGMLRVLAKIEPGWNATPDSEYGAAIDVSSGMLGPMTGDWPTTCTDWYARHPITGAPVMGRRVEQWQSLCDLALRAHRGFASQVVIGWDMALTDRGPVILEGNSNMDVSFIQRGYRQAIGRSRLGELLAYHLQALLSGPAFNVDSANSGKRLS